MNSYAWNGGSSASSRTSPQRACAAVPKTQIPGTLVSATGQGAQVNQHQPLIHALSRELRRHRIRHVVEDGVVPSLATETSEWISPWWRGSCAMRPMARTSTRASSSMEPSPTHRRRCTVGKEVPLLTALLPQPPRRVRTRTTLGRDMCPLTSVATNYAPSRWNVLGASEEWLTSLSTSWRHTSLEGRMVGKLRGKGR